MAGMGPNAFVAVVLLLAMSAITAEGMKNPLCMWVADIDPPSCLADIFGNVKNEQVLAQSTAIAECIKQTTQKTCEKTANCFWDSGNSRCTQDTVLLNQECNTAEWNVIQRTFQCPQFSTEEKCTGGELEGCAWDDSDSCAIDEAAVQKAVNANDTIKAELDQFNQCLNADGGCAPPCIEDPPNVDCFYRDLFNPIRFAAPTQSPYCQLQAVRAQCAGALNCSDLPDCAAASEDDCRITPEAIVKYTLADSPKTQRKVSKALTECIEFTTEEDCLSHK